jgi:hypothetical protein
MHHMHYIYVASHTCTFVIDHAEKGRMEPPEHLTIILEFILSLSYLIYDS